MIEDHKIIVESKKAILLFQQNKLNSHELSFYHLIFYFLKRLIIVVEILNRE